MLGYNFVILSKLLPLIFIITKILKIIQFQHRQILKFKHEHVLKAEVGFKHCLFDDTKITKYSFTPVLRSNRQRFVRGIFKCSMIVRRCSVIGTPCLSTWRPGLDSRRGQDFFFYPLFFFSGGGLDILPITNFKEALEFLSSVLIQSLCSPYSHLTHGHLVCKAAPRRTILLYINIDVAPRWSLLLQNNIA